MYIHLKKNLNIKNILGFTTLMTIETHYQMSCEKGPWLTKFRSTFLQYLQMEIGQISQVLSI